MNFVLIIAVPLPPNYIKILINHASKEIFYGILVNAFSKL